MTHTPSTHFDVLIVGAGISGIGAAHHLQDQCPNKSFIILESKADFGGTWRTHTYPGIRSDSDLYTFGYRFKPWTGKPVASAESILEYMDEVIEEDKTAEHIRYNTLVHSASWSSKDQQYTITAQDSASGETLTYTANFLFMCHGYYEHDKGYTPDFPGLDDFKGDLIHPQTWPENYDYSGKKIIVIGSGATAATIIPNMADKAGHITMLQRSPTYFWTGENKNDWADQLRAIDIPEEWIHEIVRRKILAEGQEIQAASKDHPEVLKAELMNTVRQHLGEDFDVDTHFNPSYYPWRQRLAYIPDGDLFAGIKSGKVDVVTDHIERFTSSGIQLKSGQELEADVIITATGFDLKVMGGIAFDVDGEAVDFAERFSWRGLMIEGVPNMVSVFGYFRTSWTMRLDLIGDFVCRLLNDMTAKGVSSAVPTLRRDELNMPKRPWIDPAEFNPGYLQRRMHLMPKTGDREPWMFTVDYYEEKDTMPKFDLHDGSLVFGK